MTRKLAAATLALVLAGCGSTPEKRAGGYYLDDGPPENLPAKLEAIPDATPKAEPLLTSTMRPYTALGTRFVPMTQLRPYRARGIASWYGRRYHGRPTASGEPYDMLAMTAAHPILPIPSYVKVTNLSNGRTVIVRVNDRGPFLAQRLLDLSYAAAAKLQLAQAGSAQVEVELIIPDTETIATYVQAGAFARAENAEALAARLRGEGESWLSAIRIVHKNGLHRVILGPYDSNGEAASIAARIARLPNATEPLLIKTSAP